METQMQVDSLNTRAYRLRYVDVDSVEKLVSEAFAQSESYADGRNEARCNEAYVLYQRMNFDAVDSLLQVVRNDSRNRLLLLCADVMQMKTTQRTGDGQLFYEAKTRAEGYLKYFGNRYNKLSPRERKILVYAQSEFHIISSTYYYYLEQDSLAQMEIERVEPCMKMSVDTVQWVYYNYMLGSGGLVKGTNIKEILVREFDYLFHAYMLSIREQLPYFEANTLQALSIMFLHHKDFLQEVSPKGVLIISALLSGDGTETERLLSEESLALQQPSDLPLAMCHRALSLFKAYRDLFQTACTYRTLGEIYFERGDYGQALESYSEALHCVNEHHLRYYGSFSPDTLSAFNPAALERSVEMEWISDRRISTVPEWIAGIRQQFSLTYSALNMRQASDYNRNFYLDLIQSTNQNLELENRTMELQRQTKALYGRMLLFILLAILAIAMFFLLRRRLKRQSTQGIQRLERTLNYLRTGELPTRMRSKEEEQMEPYRDFVSWNTRLLASLREALDEVDERVQVCRQHLTDNKRKNAENRAKVSLVHAIVPFLDRIGGEVYRMKQEGEVKPERQTYIRELVEQIDRYNQILTEWIKMEQGTLTLHVSTVSLAKLYQIVAEGHYAFDQKKVALFVEPTEAFVKADESLTLFMLNTLADNARKFTPEGGCVTISAEETDEYVEVRVTDTGCGLSAEDVDTLTNSKIYDAAEIGKAHTGGKGFGFGLMNCRGIIEKYKKTSALFSCCAFGVRSRVGEGSTFYFRLPRVLQLLFLSLLLPLSVDAAISSNPSEIESTSSAVSGAYQVEGTAAVSAAERLYLSVYEANVDGRFEDAIAFAEEAFATISCEHPLEQPLLLTAADSVPHDAAELRWAQQGVVADYALIVALRNEVALAALALHEWSLYQYNNHACIRLHKFTHLDKSLPSYYHCLQQTHRRSNLWLFFILVVALVMVFLAYRLLVSTQVRIGRNLDELSGYCQRLLCVARTESGLQDYLSQTAPMPGTDGWAERFRQQIADISVRPAEALKADIAQQTDERAKLEYEENRLYVQNQVLDNCLSTIKHESMYYPSRIRMFVEKMGPAEIGQLSELVDYYHHIYTLLCQQADAQVRQPGFRRQCVDVAGVIGRASATFRRIARKSGADAQVECRNPLEPGICVVADETLLDLLIESLLSGMLQQGGPFLITADNDGRFVRFTLRDLSHAIPPVSLADLFYPDDCHISYLVAKQILREHDTYANHPGCRLDAQPTADGYEIYFTLLRTVRLDGE